MIIKLKLVFNEKNNFEIIIIPMVHYLLSLSLKNSLFEVKKA
tara:strand:- start:441 stop:566 length:126 start_codon:yes stop_codon:yes gene_type:complete